MEIKHMFNMLPLLFKLTSLRKTEHKPTSSVNCYAHVTFYFMLFLFIILSANKGVRQILFCLKVIGCPWKIASHIKFNSVVKLYTFMHPK